MTPLPVVLRVIHNIGTHGADWKLIFFDQCMYPPGLCSLIWEQMQKQSLKQLATNVTTKSRRIADDKLLFLLEGHKQWRSYFFFGEVVKPKNIPH